MIDQDSEALRSRLLNFDRSGSSIDEDSARYQCHGIFAYPAMMVPRLQGVLMDELLVNRGPGAVIYDPFMGAATVLSESISRGLEFYGTDINPLALLCGEVKSDTFLYKPAVANLHRLRQALGQRREGCLDIPFERLQKWFPKYVFDVLARIRISIMSIEDQWCRRIFWLALAETVRKFSRTRLSTYKLHIDKSYKCDGESVITDYFLSRCSRNIRLKNDAWQALEVNGLLLNGKPISKSSLELSDVRCSSASFQADIVVTSPPYGDNQTTVTYGQFSYLPLQFIDIDDIGQKFDRAVLGGASRIDSASLGGSHRCWREKLSCIEQHSQSLKSISRILKGREGNGLRRLAVFTFDLREAFIAVSQRVKPTGYWMMTLGNRTITNVSVPLDEICFEFLQALGFSKIATVSRTISKKRMAGSMRNENILILRKER